MTPRSKIIRALALVWIIGVSAYFIYDLYQGVRYGLYQNGVNQGYASAVNELITKVSGKCDAPTPINAGDKKVEIVDVSCLKIQPPAETNSGSIQSPSSVMTPSPKTK